MNLKLVKLTPEYKRHLTDMMSEWLAAERDFSPYVIRKNDYRDFDYYLENLETKHYDGRLVPDSTFYCLDTDRDIFVGAVNIRHFLTHNLYPFGGHIGDGVRPSERRKGIATAMIGLALEKCRELGIYRVLMTCDEDNIGSAKSIRNNGGVLLDTLINEDGVPEQIYAIDLTPASGETANAFCSHLSEILNGNAVEACVIDSSDIALRVKRLDALTQMNDILGLNGIRYRGKKDGTHLYECVAGDGKTVLHKITASEA